MLKAIAFRIIIKPDPTAGQTVTFGGQEIDIKKIDGHWVTPNGIEVDHLVDEKQELGATVTGTIVDIGPDAWASYKPSKPFADLVIGDHVYYAKYAGKWVTDFETGEDFLVVNDDDIVCRYSGIPEAVPLV